MSCIESCVLTRAHLAPFKEGTVVMIDNIPNEERSLGELSKVKYQPLHESKSPNTRERIVGLTLHFKTLVRVQVHKPFKITNWNARMKPIENSRCTEYSIVVEVSDISKVEFDGTMLRLHSPRELIQLSAHAEDIVNIRAIIDS